MHVSVTPQQRQAIAAEAKERSKPGAKVSEASIVRQAIDQYLDDRKIHNGRE